METGRQHSQLSQVRDPRRVYEEASESRSKQTVDTWWATPWPQEDLDGYRTNGYQLFGQTGYTLLMSSAV